MKSSLIVSSRDFLTIRYKEINEYDATILNISVKSDCQPEVKGVVRATQKVYLITYLN